jgi:hypothetical protein
MLFLLLVLQASEVYPHPLAAGVLSTEQLALQRYRSEGQMLNDDGKGNYLFRFFRFFRRGSRREISRSSNSPYQLEIPALKLGDRVEAEPPAV